MIMGKGDYTSVGLSEKYLAWRRKRVLYLRDVGKVTWGVVMARLDIGHKLAKKIYLEAKKEEQQK